MLYEKKKAIAEYDAKICGLENECTRVQKEFDLLVFQPVSTAEIEESFERLEVQKRMLDNEYEEYRIDLARNKEEAARIAERSQVETLRNVLDSIIDRAAKSKELLIKLKEERTNLLAEAENERMKNDEISKSVYAYEKQISFLKNNQYDQSTKQILKQFETVAMEMKRIAFEDRVIGPICTQINLKDYKWYRPASIILKKSLNTYIVFNTHDNRRLFSLFKRLSVPFTIAQQSSKKVIRNLRKPEGFLTLLDVIEFKEELIQNHLITMHSIEQIILVPDRERAYPPIKERVKNIDSAYTREGDRIKLTNGSLSDFKSRTDGKLWFENNNSKINSIERSMELLKIDKKYQTLLNECNGNITRLEGEVRTTEHERLSLEAKIAALGEFKETSDHFEKQIVNLERRLAGLESRISLIKQEMDNEREKKRVIGNENSIKRKEILRKKEEIRNSIGLMSKEIATLESKKGEIICACRKWQEDVDEKILKFNGSREQAVRASKDDSINVAHEQDASDHGSHDKDSCNSPWKNILRENDHGRALEQHNHGIDALNQSRTDKVLSDTLKATPICSVKVGSVPGKIHMEYFLKASPRKLGDILKERSAIKEHIRLARKMNSKEEVEKEIDLIEKEIKINTRIIDKYRDLINQTEEAIEIRVSKRDEIKGIKTAESAALFREYTAKNGYEGDLVFDHESMRLDIRMKVHNISIGGSKSTLSGGERSYAAVYFLLSLWRCCSCPVKVLDEFDVFMDVLNRRTAIRTLLEFFRENKMQAIFITPLNTEDLVDENCQIMMLKKAK